MARPSEPFLVFLRGLLDKRGLNTAAIAAKCDIPRARIRRILTGAEDMTVDELIKLNTALELSPADLGLAGVIDPPEAAGPDPSSADPTQKGPTLAEAPPEAPAEPTFGVDPWGNHPEQLVRIAFALGCDFMFLADPSQLQTSGLPEAVLKSYEKSNLPIKLDAAYHRYNTPRYDDVGVTLTLSFDQLYDCTFPWSAFRQVLFFPVQPDPVGAPAKPEERKKPTLRLVE